MSEIKEIVEIVEKYPLSEEDKAKLIEEITLYFNDFLEFAAEATAQMLEKVKKS